MTSWVVADSSIFIATVVRDTQTIHAEALIAMWTRQRFRIAAPYLFRYEVTSTIRKHIARGTLLLDTGREAIKSLNAYPIEYFTDDDLLDRGFELATQYGRSTAYDSFYLALAERLKCDFWTGDLKLFNAVSASLTGVKWSGNFPIPPNP